LNPPRKHVEEMAGEGGEITAVRLGVARQHPPPRRPAPRGPPRGTRCPRHALVVRLGQRAAAPTGERQRRPP
jgi:hypothetical protein